MTEISNLTALRNLAITTETVYVKGYTDAGDGGVGSFYGEQKLFLKQGYIVLKITEP